MAFFNSQINYCTKKSIIFGFVALRLVIIPQFLLGQEVINLIQPSRNTINQIPTAFGKLFSTSSIEEYKRFNEELPGEKIYLHLDRPDFMQGDTIWFKAYSWFGSYQVPDTLSRVLYVDLLSPEGRVKLSRKVLIQNGLSNGDFTLDTTIIPGRYTIRAYTRWMQNLNTGEPFYQNITISSLSQNFQVECTPIILKQAGNDSLRISFRFFEIDQRGDLKNSLNHEVNYSLTIGAQVLNSGNVKATNTKEQVIKSSLSGITKNDSVAVFELFVKDDRLTFEKQFRIPLLDGIDLQFFPEGGKLVTGLESKVAFKAIGTDGLSREVKGEIRDNEEKVVTGFESTHKGMGAFLLKPEIGKEYFAHLWYNNRKYIIPLPHAIDDGCVMSVGITGNGNEPYLTIKRGQKGAIGKKYIAGSAYGIIWFVSSVNTTKDSLRTTIPMELLTEGICRLTLLNSDFKPECERLIYVNKNQRFKIEVEPDSSSYGTRSKVTLLIKTTGPDGAPLQTDLSLAVVDKEQITTGEEVNAICEYKLLQSELKGHIEDAGFYFKDDSCANYGALDLLLLTQGYRKFLPTITDPDKQKFQPERSFDISGKIKFNGLKIREKRFNYSNIGLTLMCRSEGVYLDQTTSDSLGRFRFQIPLLTGKSHSLIQTTTSKGKLFYGEIFLDETIGPPKFGQPPEESFNFASLHVENVQQLQAVKKAEISKNPWIGLKTIDLPEVMVTAKAKNWYLDFDKEAKKIVTLDTLDPDGNRYKNINELLVQEFGARRVFIPGVGLETIELPCVNIKFSYWYPIYVINGETYFNGSESGQICVHLLNSLSVLHVNEIKRLMVLPPGNIAAHYAGDLLYIGGIRQSLVVIETYNNNTYRGDPMGIKTFVLDGLDAPRIFYSPRYEGSSRKSQAYDGRVTLYWNPSIRTDSTGQAKAEFFTSDRQTVLQAIINGIETRDGTPGQKQTIINSTLLK